MIALMNDTLLFSFPEVHPDAHMEIDFQRTLRIPDDDQVHYLPPGLGGFPLRHIDDFDSRVPDAWREHGGVMMPMFQSEAMWLSFGGRNHYPFLIKIATGKINAVTGEVWCDEPNRDPQDYVVLPDQPWLDGYCVKKGEIRQFVAMPLGKGFTAEEQITGQAEHGGIQIVAYPMKAEVWRRMRKDRQESLVFDIPVDAKFCMLEVDMGLAPGGRMKQEIYDDPHAFDVWDLRHRSRCFVHIANSLTWRAITGEAPPTMPPTAEQYSEAGLPWFDYYSENTAVEGSDNLAGIKSVKEMDETALPENASHDPEKIIVIREGERAAVREEKI